MKPSRLLVSGLLAFGLAMVSPLAGAEEASINAWLMRLHEASRHRTYTGTFVVSAAGKMASARIWHVCDGEQQVERVESLSGTPRATFRRNDEVVTFFPGWLWLRAVSHWGYFPICSNRMLPALLIIT